MEDLIINTIKRSAINILKDLDKIDDLRLRQIYKEQAERQLSDIKDGIFEMKVDEEELCELLEERR